MHYSHKLKFTFIHIHRTGGSAIENLLIKASKDTQQLPNQHENTRSSEGIKHLNQYSEYHKFAFVRNPWARIFSWYSIKKGKMNLSKEEIKNFSNYLVAYFDYSKSDPFFHFNQLDYITDNDGHLLVDSIGRHETFNEDLKVILDKLGISGTTAIVNKSQGLSYSDFYTAKTRAFIAEKCAQDIEHFGYTF